MVETQWAKSLHGDAIEAESTSSQSPSSDPATDPTSYEDFDQPLNDPSVVVGLACRVPGASNPSQLWQNIQGQKDIQKKIPADRFNVDTFYHPDGTHKGTVSRTKERSESRLVNTNAVRPTPSSDISLTRISVTLTLGSLTSRGMRLKQWTPSNVYCSKLCMRHWKMV